LPLPPLLPVPDVPPLLPEREPLLREREPVLFERELDFVGDLPLVPELDDLREAEERLEPVPDDLARLVPDFLAPPVERDEADLAPLVERFDVVLRLLVPELRPLLERPLDPVDALDDEAEPPLDDDISIFHLPDITR
jgi:hypothetical protein